MYALSRFQLAHGRNELRQDASWPLPCVGLALALVASAGCNPVSSWPRQPPAEPVDGAMREVVSIDQSFSFLAGDVLAGQPLRHVFHYRNDSSAPLRHPENQTIRTTCGCTRVQLSQQRLEPGKSAELSIEIDTDNRLGDVSESATVTWYTEAGEPRNCQFTLSGRVMSAFAFDPPELTFSKADLRAGTCKTVRCRSDIPIDWQQVQLEADESYVFVESRRVDHDANSLVFSVGCQPTHQGDHRQTAIRLAGSISQSTNHNLAERVELYRAALPVYSHDFAALRISPRIPVFAPDTDRVAWVGYLILTGDVIETGTNLRQVATESCEVKFETLALGLGAQRVDLKLLGPVDSLQPDERKLQLTFDNGLQQAVGFQLESL